MFEDLEEINRRPGPFEFYDAKELWTEDYRSKQMLSFHLNEKMDVASRNVDFINRSVEWVVSRFNVQKGMKIADFGCGPGLYTSRLAKSGAEVTGIDFSKRSIEYARQAAAEEQLDVRYINEDYLECEMEDRFDLILMIMCDFCALSPGQRTNLLKKFREILKEHGSVLLDVYSLAAFRRRKEETIYEKNLLNGFWSPNEYYGFLNTFKYQNEKLILDKYTIIEPNGIQSFCNWLQYFSPDDLEAQISECGLTIEEMCSDAAGAPFNPESEEFAVVITKGKP